MMSKSLYLRLILSKRLSLVEIQANEEGYDEDFITRPENFATCVNEL